MKITKKTTKILSTVAALMLISATQAHAGSITLDGQIDYIDTVANSGIAFDSPVSLELTWTNDSLINPVGESTVYFRSDWGNTMLLTMGQMTLAQTPGFPSNGEMPYAHFTDGVLDGFFLDWFPVTFGGVTGSSWGIYITPDVAYDYTTGNIYFEVVDNGSATGAWFEGSFNTPSAVPVPGAVWLLGSGLVGLAGLRRKVK